MEGGLVRAIHATPGTFKTTIPCGERLTMAQGFFNIGGGSRQQPL